MADAYSHTDMNGHVSKVSPDEVNRHIAGLEQQEAALKAMPPHISAEISALSLRQIARCLTYFMERDMGRKLENGLGKPETPPETKMPLPGEDKLISALRKMGIKVVKL